MTNDDTTLFQLYSKKYIFSIGLLFCLLLLGQNIKAVDFNDSSFGIAEFDTQEIILNLLETDNNISNIGLSISIETDVENKNLQLKLRSGELAFVDFLKILKAYLENNKEYVFPLFIKFDEKESALIDDLKSVQLYNKVFYQPPGERWSSIENILAQNKQLIIFTQSENHKKTSLFNKTTEHIVDFTINNSQDIKTQQVAYLGSIKNELLLIRKFTNESLLKKDVPNDWSKISLNNYSIDYLLECWNITGKRPNFIFYSEPKHSKTFHYLTKIIRNFDSFSGEVSTGGKLLNGINWKHDKKSYTGGYFNFPYMQQTSLAPLRKGYAFDTKKIQIDAPTKENERIKFTAHPLQITDGLSASYRLNNTITNRVKPKQQHIQTNTFVDDNERGVVLKLENGDFATLRNVNDYGIVNSSFTISVYFKLMRNGADANDCIVGSNEEGYRKGLHALVKHGRALFGFYTTDCSADVEIPAMKWHQLTVRYDINAQTQSIFIDGEKVGHSPNHPSFIGSTELLLGHGIKQDNFMNGYLDDVNIWNRALSREEIKWIYKNNIEIEEQNWISQNSSLLIGVFAVLFVALFVLIFLFSKKRKATNSIETKPQPLKNAIYLYGKFTVLDGNGKDHSSKFSPKTRELFLLLLLHSIKNTKGILTGKLTEIIWSGFSVEKASNNRGVTFNHLKKILAEINGIEAVYQNKYWRLVLADEIICDYKLAYNYLAEKRNDYSQLYALINRGEFLAGVKKEWLLDYQSTHSFDLIDRLLEYSKELFKQKDFDTILEVAAYIITLDDLNVQALHFQLRCLSKLGSGNKAAFLFDKFTQRYKAVNSKNFEYNFKSFLKIDVDALWE